jgi:hypothetical protein
MTVLIIGTWGRLYKRVTSDMTVEVTRLYDLLQVLMIKTDMSEVTRLYDLP